MDGLIRVFVVGGLSLLLIACCDSEKGLPSVPQSDPKERKSIVDSPDERRLGALKVIAKYPMKEWENDIITKISIVAGKTTSQEFRNLVRSRLTNSAVAEKRIALLVETYTVEELTTLSELYSSPQGRELLRKFSGHEDKLRELVSPLIMEVLSNAPVN